MKCQAIVRTGVTGKKRKKTKTLWILSLFNEVVKGITTQAMRTVSKDWNDVRCDGNVSVNIRAIDEPEWGGSFANLEVEYKCEKCGNIHFEELPNSDIELSEFMQEAIGALTEKQRDIRLAKHKKQEEERQKLFDKHREEVGKGNNPFRR